MISVGYGDISPTTNNERLAVIVMTIISSVKLLFLIILFIFIITLS